MAKIPKWTVSVDGVQVWTADFVMDMLTAQSKRIRRAQALAKAALAVSAVSALLAAVLLIRLG